MIESFNPATEEVLARYEEYDDAAVDARLARAAAAQQAWRRRAAPERAALLKQVAAVLRSGQEGHARLITLEMGKPLAEARGEVEKCAWALDYYAEQAAAFLEDRPVASAATDSRVVYDPLGLVLAIMPWNYPFWQVMRAAAPVLAGGNGLVLKHAANVPQCALALEQACLQAGLPEGLFTTLLVGSPRVQGVIEDPRIAAVTFTGSTQAGRLVASQAGRALKKQVLELGGSDPFIVLADADVAQAAAVAAKARFQNTGQSCIAAKRFIVEASVADDFVDALCEAVGALVVGDPLHPATTQGSMARARLRDELHAQVQASIAEGAALRLGGAPVPGKGAFYAPTILDHVGPDMTAAREETFGPAAAILRVRNAQEAITIANRSEFGLGAALWTSDLERARGLVREIEAGAVFVNGLVASDPRLPFGGIKQSGYGRELGAFGLHEFTNIKTVWTGPARAAKT